MTRSRKRDRREGTSVCWETLCPDVRGHILSKLSLREHASAAPVCREFLEELLNRVAKERATRILLAEEAIGKAVFNGFVTAFQRVMCGLPAYPGGPPHLKVGETLVIRAAAPELVIKVEDLQSLAISMPRSGLIRVVDAPHVLQGGLSQIIGGHGIGIALPISKHPINRSKLYVLYRAATARVASGLLLAICTGNPAATAAHWQNPLREIHLRRQDMRKAQFLDEAGRRETEGEKELTTVSPDVNCRVYYGSGLELDGKSARERRARCRAAAHAVAAAGKKAWESEWHGEGLGLCSPLLYKLTTLEDSPAAIGAQSQP